MTNLLLLTIFGVTMVHSESWAGSFFDKALDGAEAAITTCREKGFHVTATVVNAEGLSVVVLRDNGASPHTLDSAKQKAYTAVSFSPIVNIDKTSEIAQRLLANPMSAQLAHIQNILLVGGGVAIRSNGKVVGGIGVGGAPGGNLDEECANAGAQKMMKHDKGG